MMHRKVRLAMVLVAALALAASSCSASNEQADPDDPAVVAANQALIDALEIQMVSDPLTAMGFDGQCFAQAIVPALGGAERIEAEFAITAASVQTISDNPIWELYPKDDAAKVAEAAAQCEFLRVLLAEDAANSGLTESDLDCLVEEVAADQLGGALEGLFILPEERSVVNDVREDVFGITLFAAVGRCDTPIELTDWFTVEVNRG